MTIVLKEGELVPALNQRAMYRSGKAYSIPNWSDFGYRRFMQTFWPESYQLRALLERTRARGGTTS